VTRRTAWFVHVSSALVAGTGLVYGWMAYFATPADEFAVVGHPFQPTFQHLHVLAAPFVVFACGLAWRSHVWGRIRSGFRQRRRTGITLAVLLLPMIASGYLLQVTTDEALRTAWVWTHVATSCAWTVVYVAHQVLRRSPPGAAEPGAADGPDRPPPQSP